MKQELAFRIAVLTRLVEKVGTPLGRTALMKLTYFLVKLRGVPLGYRFSLYSYGPFDSTVLEDIDYAARLGALRVSVYGHSAGYGYSICPGSEADRTKSLAGDFLAGVEDEIDWVAREFGHWTAADLELASTIVYVDQEVQSRGQRQSVDQIVRQVGEIKQHFPSERIDSKVRLLANEGLLLSLA